MKKGIGWHHIYPVGDIAPHDLEGHECDCSPFLDFKHELVIHYAFDGRDLIEEAEDVVVDLPNGTTVKMNNTEIQ